MQKRSNGNGQKPEERDPLFIVDSGVDEFTAVTKLARMELRAGLMKTTVDRRSIGSCCLSGRFDNTIGKENQSMTVAVSFQMHSRRHPVNVSARGGLAGIFVAGKNSYALPCR